MPIDYKNRPYPVGDMHHKSQYLLWIAMDSHPEEPAAHLETSLAGPLSIDGAFRMLAWIDEAETAGMAAVVLLVVVAVLMFLNTCVAVRWAALPRFPDYG